MPLPEILDDPLASQIFFHLLYSGSRTNKQLNRDFSMLRIKTKRGILVRGKRGYNYIRILTDKLADASVLSRKKVGDEIIYSVNLDAKKGIMNNILFNVKTTSGDLAHHVLRFSGDQINWFLKPRIMKIVMESGIGEFNSAFDYNELECRSMLFEYRIRLERSSKHPILAVLLFLCKLGQKITDVDYTKIRDTIIKEGTERMRGEVLDDMNSFNWKVLPEEMRENIPEKELDLHVNRYAHMIGEGVMDSILSYWSSRMGMEKLDVLELISYAYIMQRLFTMLLYFEGMNKSLKLISELEFPTGMMKVHVEEMEMIKTVGLPKAKAALRKINRYLTEYKKKMIPEEVRKVVIYSGDIILPKEFAELIHIQYKKESNKKLKDRNVYLEALGKKRAKTLTLSDALEVATEKKKNVKVIDVVQLIHAVVTIEGTKILKRIKKLKEILEKAYNYENYFSKLEEMYKMKLKL